MATSTESLKTASLNNSFNYEETDSRLRAELQNSYSYLKEYQRCKVLYEEFIINSSNTESRKYKEMGHLHVTKEGDPFFELDVNHFIAPSSREKYRTSKFYATDFTIDDMYITKTKQVSTSDGYEDITVKLPNPIFDKVPIVMLDDQVIWDWKLKITKNHLRFTLPFHRDYVVMDERRSYDLTSIVSGITAADKNNIETWYSQCNNTGSFTPASTNLESTTFVNSYDKDAKNKLCNFFGISNKAIIAPSGALDIQVEMVDPDGEPISWVATLTYRMISNSEIWDRCEFYDVGAKKLSQMNIWKILNLKNQL
jgi:hypothetical protein